MKKKLTRVEGGLTNAREPLANVEAEKNEFVQYSLKQIPENFSLVFEKIVSKPGWGKIGWVYDELDRPLEDNDEDAEVLVSSV